MKTTHATTALGVTGAALAGLSACIAITKLKKQAGNLAQSQAGLERRVSYLEKAQTGSGADTKDHPEFDIYDDFGKLWVSHMTPLSDDSFECDAKVLTAFARKVAKQINKDEKDLSSINIVSGQTGIRYRIGGLKPCPVNVNATGPNGRNLIPRVNVSDPMKYILCCESEHGGRKYKDIPKSMTYVLN